MAATSGKKGTTNKQDYITEETNSNYCLVNGSFFVLMTGGRKIVPRRNGY